LSELLDKAGTPYVRLGPERADRLGPRVHMDDVAAAREMTEHLAGLGHRRIGFIVGEPRYGASEARRQGYMDAMRGLNLPVSDAWVRQGDFTFQSGLEQGKALLALPDRPTAIFASNDDMALGCLAAAAEAGVMIPGDVSVAGFDDSPSARFSRPQLTTVRQPVVEMASRATHLLISGQIKGATARSSTVEELLAFELIHRASTAPPPSQ
jgi:LacI family transcriptional regulator